MKIHNCLRLRLALKWRIHVKPYVAAAGPLGALPCRFSLCNWPLRLACRSPPLLKAHARLSAIRRHHTQPPAALLPPPFIYTSSPLPPGKRSSGQATLQHTHKHTDTHVEPTPLVRPSALGLATLTSQKHPSVQASMCQTPSSRHPCIAHTPRIAAPRPKVMASTSPTYPAAPFYTPGHSRTNHLRSTTQPRLPSAASHQQ